MFEHIGKEVEFLKRTGIGDLKLGGLSRGTYRYLTDKEVLHLKTY
jgi:16S rRNA U516 pseudouridylate synthase RsuA-like enzyme